MGNQLFDLWLDSQKESGKPISVFGAWQSGLTIAKTIVQDVMTDCENYGALSGEEAANSIYQKIEQCINGDVTNE